MSTSFPSCFTLTSPSPKNHFKLRKSLACSQRLPTSVFSSLFLKRLTCSAKDIDNVVSMFVVCVCVCVPVRACFACLPYRGWPSFSRWCFACVCVSVCAVGVWVCLCVCVPVRACVLYHGWPSFSRCCCEVYCLYDLSSGHASCKMLVLGQDTLFDTPLTCRSMCLYDCLTQCLSLFS